MCIEGKQAKRISLHSEDLDFTTYIVTNAQFVNFQYGFKDTYNNSRFGYFFTKMFGTFNFVTLTHYGKEF